MNQMNKRILLTFCVSVLALAGCGDSGSGGDGGSGASAGNGGSGGTGAGGTSGGGVVGQIDRMGRPAVNTALTQTFNPGNQVS